MIDLSDLPLFGGRNFYTRLSLRGTSTNQPLSSPRSFAGAQDWEKLTEGEKHFVKQLGDGQPHGAGEI